jgi:hypothetical protein
MGLLAGGVLANSLLLVYLAIGAAALAAIMLTAGVLIWREEVFGPTSAAKASPTAKRATGPSPVLAATGVPQPGRSPGGTAADVATIGAAAQDYLVAEPPPPALPPRPDWARSSDRPEQPDRAQRSGRPERQERPDRIKSSGRPEQREWHQRADRPGGQEEPDRARTSDRPERQEQPDSAKPSDWPERQEHPEQRTPAEPAARHGSVGQERPSRSPSGPWPEPVAEPVPGPRRGNEPASGGVPPASRAAAAADELKPLPARGPAAQGQGERDADVSAWSFFAKAGKPSEARPDLTQVAPAEVGGSREAKQSPRAASTAEAAVPDAARPASTGTGEGEDRAAAAPDAARRDTGPAAGRDRAAAGPVERDTPAEPAEPEPVSAAAERAAAKGRGPETENQSSPDTAKGSATRDGHPARGPDTEVTVVPGITRYHRSQCILIRFLSTEDLETMTMQAAEMASYIPCKACRPEQVLAGD